MFEVLIEVKELESFDHWRPVRVFISYLGLHLYFPWVLNIGPQGTSDRHSPRIIVRTDVYWGAAHVGAFYNWSTYTPSTIVPNGHLTWLGCMFFQHYSPPGLEVELRSFYRVGLYISNFLKCFLGLRRSSYAEFSFRKSYGFPRWIWQTLLDFFGQSLLIKHGWHP